MKDTRKILTDSIADHQKAIDKAEKELAKLEVTYSIGDRFKTNSMKHILGQIKGHKVAMFNLRNGFSHSGEVVGEVVVDDVHAMTEKDLLRCCTCNPVRYWDSRKGVHCD